MKQHWFSYHVKLGLRHDRVCDTKHQTGIVEIFKSCEIRLMNRKRLIIFLFYWFAALSFLPRSSFPLRTALRLTFHSHHHNTRTIYNENKTYSWIPQTSSFQQRQVPISVDFYHDAQKTRLRSHAHEHIHDRAERRTFPSDSPQRVVASRRKRAQELPTCGNNLGPPSPARSVNPALHLRPIPLFSWIAHDFSAGSLPCGVSSDW